MSTRGREITAAVARSADGEFTLEALELRPPAAGEVVVRMVATGVCHTDVVVKSMAATPATPVVLGHEGAGVVDVVGPGVTTVGPGDHVLLSFASCGSCGHCRAARRAYCDHFRTLNLPGAGAGGSLTDGAGGMILGSFFGQSSFATHVVCAVENLVAVGHDLDLVACAPLGCGFQTGAGAVINVLRPRPGSSMAVFGGGGVGLAALLAALAVGVQDVVVVDPIEDRRQLALRLGASAVIDPGADDPVTAIRDHADGGVAGAIDTTGLPMVIAQAMQALTRLGVAVALGVGPAEVSVDIRDMISGGKSLRGSTEGDSDPRAFLPDLVALHKRGVFPIDELVTPYEFSEINRAVADAVAGVTVKPVLVF